MHPLIVIHGIDYSGKSSALRGIRYEAEKIDDIPTELKEQWGEKPNESHTTRERFDRFMELNRIQTPYLQRILEEKPVIQVRNAVSTLAFHNTALSKEYGRQVRLQDRTDLSGLLTPDLSILLAVTRPDLEQRMIDRPPKHLYESDPGLLMAVQSEKLDILHDPSLEHIYGSTIIVPNPQGQLQETIDRIDRYLTNP